MKQLLCYFLVVFPLIFSWQTATSRNLDSLRTQWENQSLADTSRMNALQQLAWEGYLYSQPDSAYYFAKQLYDFAEQKGYRTWMARALNTQGNSWVVRGDYFKAFECYTQSLEISEQTGDQKELASSLHSIGIIYYYQGDHPRAIDYYTRSLTIREELNDKQGIAKSLNNIGIVYSQQAHYGYAIDFFTRSLKLSNEIGDKRGVASALNNLGLIHKETEALDSALSIYMQSLEISREIGDLRDVAATLNNISIIHEKWDDYDKAIDLLNQSLEIKEMIGDKQGMGVSYILMGNVFQKKQNYNEAVKWCLKGLNFSEQVGSLMDQETACTCLYQSYKKLHNDEKALVYHEMKAVLNDSIKDAETLRALQQMEFSRQVMTDSIAKAKERMKIQLAHESEVKKKNQTRNVFIAITIFLLIGAGSLYSRVRFIRKSRAEIAREKDRSDNLLLNILPEDIARELKEKGSAIPRKFDNVSILFTDFKDFTLQSSRLSPEELISEVNACFMVFDNICEKYRIEKIKTIGDAYMVAGGLPVPSEESTKNTVLAALEMTRFMQNRKQIREAAGSFSFEMRAGIHTGSVVAGIVGAKKFQYDIWGDSVNLASRLESAGEAGKVNISRETYQRIKNDKAFRFHSRGELMVKGKGCTEMYYVELCETNYVSEAFG